MPDDDRPLLDVLISTALERRYHTIGATPHDATLAVIHELLTWLDQGAPEGQLDVTLWSGR